MSVDFSVFDPASAPRDPQAFRAWFEDQMDLAEASNFEPSDLSTHLRKWYDAMVAEFPDLERSTHASDKFIEYCLSPSLVYCSMSTQYAEEAEALYGSLVRKCEVGRYEPMFDDGRRDDCIMFPDGPSASPE